MAAVDLVAGVEGDSVVEISRRGRDREKEASVRGAETAVSTAIAKGAHLGVLPVTEPLPVSVRKENSVSSNSKERKEKARRVAEAAVVVAVGEVVAGRMRKTPEKVAVPEVVQGVNELQMLTTNVTFLLSQAPHLVWKRASRESAWFSYVGSIANNCSVETCLC